MPTATYEKLGSFYLGNKVDEATGKDTDELVMYDSPDLTTHAVCVGMTGSGKTGLCVDLIEEAAIDGVPVIAIDPKGDIANLALRFPQLRAEDFLPWVDAGEAARKGHSSEAYAAATAEAWKKGLAQWQQDGERIARLCEAAEVTVYTPGSNSGRPLSVLRSFAAPDAVLLADSIALKERISNAASGLLGLLSIEADALQSREHILLSRILETAWRAGEDLDLSALINRIQKPPFDKVGVFDLETFFPSKDRLALAVGINNLLAAPGFSAWLEGDPLDVQRLLFTAAGKPRVSVISIAHLGDAERMFVVTLLLNEVVAWMRKQSGTASLRAVIYMDEIFGYFPPTATPPSKLPLLTLMKQARAFGVGVVLATQNPVDLDYKGLSNAGTWFIGRLQTERDKARVVEGLLSSAGDGLSKERMDSLLANLSQRVFLMRNVHETAPVLLRTRWALSYLRGPMTLQEIARLKQPAGGEADKLAAAAAPLQLPSKPTSRPAVQAGVRQYFLAYAADATTYVPQLLGVAKIHFVDAASAVDTWQTRYLLAPLTDKGDGPDWSAAAILPAGKADLRDDPAPGIQFAEPPAVLLRAENYMAWRKTLAAALYQTQKLKLLRCDLLKQTSTAGESEGDFCARLAFLLRERRDAEVERLRKQYAPRLRALQDRTVRAEQRVESQRSQLSHQKLQTALSVGASILGAFLGRKALSSSTLGRATTAARSAGRISRESQDVDQASESLEAVRKRLADLEVDLQQQIGQLQAQFDPAALVLEPIEIPARKSDITVEEVAVGWRAV